MKDKKSNQSSRYGLKALLIHVCFCGFLSVLVFCAWSSYLWYQHTYQDASNYLFREKNQAIYMMTARYAWIDPYLLQAKKQTQHIEHIIVQTLDSKSHQLQHRYPSVFKNREFLSAGFYSKPLGQWLALLISSMELSFWKLIVLISPVVLYGFAWLLGLLEGLLDREIRIAEGSRESSWFFHQITRWIYQFFFLGLLTYFMLPVIWTPFPWIVACCLFCFALGNVGMAYLKKFL